MCRRAIKKRLILKCVKSDKNINKNPPMTQRKLEKHTLHPNENIICVFKSRKITQI